MLSEFLRKKLNPLQINLVSCKDIPFKTEPRYKPIYASCEFVDGETFTTLEMPQQPHCKFMHKQVFFVGKHDAVSFKEMLATKLVRVFLHDCDEYTNEPAKFSVGQATFTFKDFLRPFCHELKLRSDVFPMKREEIDNTKNLDLNTTARKNEKTVEKFSPYLINATYCVIQANLAYPVGSFNLERELTILADKNAVQKSGEFTKPSTVSPDSKHQRAPSTISALSDGRPSSAPVDVDPNAAIYERMIIIVPYKAAVEVKNI